MTECPVCHSRQLRPFYDYHTFRLDECADCGLLFQPFFGDGDDLNDRLITDVYSREWVAMRDRYQEDTMRQHASFGVTLLRAHLPPAARVLEIGSGTGEFLYLARQYGFQVAGIEPSPAACDYVREKYKLELTPAKGYLDELKPAQQFDAICFWHVLEHIPDPRRFLRGLKAHLVDEGLLFLSLPNRDSLTNLIYGPASPLFTEPDHLLHFSAANLRRLIAEQFAVVALFSREEDTRLKLDLDAFSRLNPKVLLSRDFMGLVSMKARLESENAGHELYCIARNLSPNRT